MGRMGTSTPTTLSGLDFSTTTKPGFRVIEGNLCLVP
jgi:hypothetical protein